MKKELLQEIKKTFPDEFLSNGFDYLPKKEDLLKLFTIINKQVFKDKLDISLLTIDIQDISSAPGNERGTFTLIDEALQHSKIVIFTYASGNNFSQIVSVLCHEMIHMYDRYFGKMKTALFDAIFGKDDFNVTRSTSTQYVHGYDVHGRYFCDWIAKFSKFGVKVKISYAADDRKLFKMIDEDDVDLSIFNDKNLYESDEVDDPIFKDRLETFVEHLKSPYKKLGYVDKDHWYITIA